MASAPRSPSSTETDSGAAGRVSGRPKAPTSRVSETDTPTAPEESAAGEPDEIDPAPDETQKAAVLPVNTEPPEASNKEQRIREAEEDRVLIAKAQRGDESTRTAAFRQLVERHQRRAFAIAFGLVRDENDAREVVQEAFLRVYRGLATFEGSSSFFTWLYRIVTNLSIDLIRKPGRKTAELDETRGVDDEADGQLALISRIDGADPIDVMRRKEIASRIQSALDALPSYHRAVILMREVEGMSYEEMAEAMNVSKGTIMSRLFHARQKMQRALADCYAEQGYVQRSSGDASPSDAAIGESSDASEEESS